MPPRWLPLAVGAALFCVAGALRFRILPNGEPLATKGYAFQLEAEDWTSLRRQVWKRFKSTLYQGDNKDWWLASESGRRLSSWEQLLALPEEEPQLIAVPAGRLFQWSPRAVGQRFPIELSDRTGVELETVASFPRIFLIHNLLAVDEAVGLIEKAFEGKGENALQQSGIGFKTIGERNKGSERTSASAFDGESPIAKRLMKRAFEVLRVPFQQDMADGLQILRYKEGQAYIVHNDWFPAGEGGTVQNFDSQSPGGSNRFATLFLYLWSPPTGGYTVFPSADLDPALEDSAFISTGSNATLREAAVAHAKDFYADGAWEVSLTEQCFTKLAVKPVQLGAALFYHQDPMSGRLLPQAQHGACPSLTGTKWGANLWLWNTKRHLTINTTEDLVKEVSAKFRNDENHDVDLAWSTDGGNRWVHFSAVGAGSYSTAKTYAGHMWRFTRPSSGTEVRAFVVPAETSRVLFSSASELPVPEKEEM